MFTPALFGLCLLQPLAPHCRPQWRRERRSKSAGSGGISELCRRGGGPAVFRVTTGCARSALTFALPCVMKFCEPLHLCGKRRRTEQLSGWTPLLLASKNNFESIVRVLLAYGASVDQRRAVSRGATAWLDGLSCFAACSCVNLACLECRPG